MFSGMLRRVMPFTHLSVEEAVEERNEESLEWGQKMCRVRPEGKFPYSSFQGSLRHVDEVRNPQQR